MKRTVMTDGVYRKYEKLAYWTAHSWNRTTVSALERLIDESILAMLEAYRRFDPSKAQFSTYVKRCIDSRLWNVTNKRKELLLEELPEIKEEPDAERLCALQEMIESLSREAREVVEAILKGTLEVFGIEPRDRHNTKRRKIREKAGREVFLEIKAAIQTYLW